MSPHRSPRATRFHGVDTEANMYAQHLQDMHLESQTSKNRGSTDCILGEREHSLDMDRRSENTVTEVAGLGRAVSPVEQKAMTCTSF